MAGEILHNPARGGEMSILGRGHRVSQAQTISRGNRHITPLAFLHPVSVPGNVGGT
jgi:hypothetical protein